MLVARREDFISLVDSRYKRGLADAELGDLGGLSLSFSVRIVAPDSPSSIRGN